MTSEREWNGRHCPYYGRYHELAGHDPNAVCEGGCSDEPACVTDEPFGGWPRSAWSIDKPSERSIAWWCAELQRLCAPAGTAPTPWIGP